MTIVSVGFLAVFVIAFWISGRVGDIRQSAGLGMIAGLVSFALLLVAYVTALTIWLRAQLMAFIETELPLVLDRLVQLADQIRMFKESI